MADKSLPSNTIPKVPESQQIDISALKEPEMTYAPMTSEDFAKWLSTAYDTQLQYSPYLAQAQAEAQSVLFRNLSALQREQSVANLNPALVMSYAAAPEFYDVYRRLGARTAEGLEAGYTLGPD